MKSLKIIIIWMLALIASTIVNAQKTFTSAELKVIDSRVDSLMSLYTQYSTFTSDLDNVSDEYIEGFSQLFSSRVSEIYNDIDYTKKSPKKITVVKYIEFVKKWYPGGLSTELKTLQKFPPRYYNGKYLIGIRVSKVLNGLYNNQVWQRYKGEQLFTIEFDDKLSSFFLQTIDEKGGQDKCAYWNNIARTFLNKSDCNLALSAYDSVLKYCPSDPEAISGLKKCDSCIQANKKPVYLVIHALPGLSSVSLSSNDNASQITTTGSMGYQGGIGMELALTKGNKGMLSVGLLLDIAVYNSDVNVNEMTGTYESIDIDQDPYTLHAAVNSLKETDNLTYFQIPLYIRYDLSMSKMISLYGKIGAKAGFSISGSYTSTWSGDYSGQYKQYNNIILHGNELSEYGFGYYKNMTATSDNNNLNSINISGFAGIGINLTVSNNIEIFLGGDFTKGITDLSKSGGSSFSITQGKDQINSVYGLSNASSQFFGGEIGVRIKVFKY